MDILKLPALRTLPFEPEGEGYVIPAEPDPLTACPHCGGAVVGFGRRPQNYADIPMHGKQVVIRVDRRRWRCKDCRKVSVDPLPAMDERREATKRLVEFVRSEWASGRRKTHIAREVGIGEQTVRNILADCAGLTTAPR